MVSNKVADVNPENSHVVTEGPDFIILVRAVIAVLRRKLLGEHVYYWVRQESVHDMSEDSAAWRPLRCHLEFRGTANADRHLTVVTRFKAPDHGVRRLWVSQLEGMARLCPRLARWRGRRLRGAREVSRRLPLAHVTTGRIRQPPGKPKAIRFTRRIQSENHGSWAQSDWSAKESLFSGDVLSGTKRRVFGILFLAVPTLRSSPAPRWKFKMQVARRDMAEVEVRTVVCRP